MAEFHPPILPESEIRAITGLERPSAQLRFLRERLHVGQAFINRQNRVIVYRSWIEPAGQAEPSAPLPDFEAMDHVA